MSAHVSQTRLVGVIKQVDNFFDVVLRFVQLTQGRLYIQTKLGTNPTTSDFNSISREQSRSLFPSFCSFCSSCTATPLPLVAARNAGFATRLREPFYALS